MTSHLCSTWPCSCSGSRCAADELLIRWLDVPRQTSGGKSSHDANTPPRLLGVSSSWQTTYGDVSDFCDSLPSTWLHTCMLVKKNWNWAMKRTAIMFRSNINWAMTIAWVTSVSTLSSPVAVASCPTKITKTFMSTNFVAQHELFCFKPVLFVFFFFIYF